MNYKLIKELEDTWFYEFIPGKYDGKYKSVYSKFDTNSVYISSEAIELIRDCLHTANKKYRINNKITVYTKKRGKIQLLRDQLQIRYKEIVDGKDFSGKLSPEIINDLKKYKDEILIMIKDLISWIDELKEKELTIIGTHDKFADLILHGCHEFIYRKGIPIGEILKGSHDIPQDILDAVV